MIKMETRPHLMHSIIPPHMAQRILEKGTPGQKLKAEAYIRIAGQMRGQRQQLSELTRRPTAAAGERVRKVYDAQNESELPGTLVRSEGAAPTGDAAVEEAYVIALDRFVEIVFDRLINANC